MARKNSKQNTLRCEEFVLSGFTKIKKEAFLCLPCLEKRGFFGVSGQLCLLWVWMNPTCRPTVIKVRWSRRNTTASDITFVLLSGHGPSVDPFTKGEITSAPELKDGGEAPLSQTFKQMLSGSQLAGGRSQLPYLVAPLLPRPTLKRHHHQVEPARERGR